MGISFKTQIKTFYTLNHPRFEIQNSRDITLSKFYELKLKLYDKLDFYKYGSIQRLPLSIITCYQENSLIRTYENLDLLKYPYFILGNERWNKFYEKIYLLKSFIESGEASDYILSLDSSNILISSIYNLFTKYKEEYDGKWVFNKDDLFQSYNVSLNSGVWIAPTYLVKENLDLLLNYIDIMPDDQFAYHMLYQEKYAGTGIMITDDKFKIFMLSSSEKYHKKIKINLEFDKPYDEINGIPKNFPFASKPLPFIAYR